MSGGGSRVAVTAGAASGLAYVLLQELVPRVLQWSVRAAPEVARAGAELVTSVGGAVLPAVVGAGARLRSWGWSALQLLFAGFHCFRAWVAAARDRHRSWLGIRRMEPGSFALIARGQEFDEVWLGCPVAQYPGSAPGAEWIVRTTDDNVTRFHWAHVRMVVGAVYPVTGVGAQRRVPPGVPPASVNWLCAPPDAAGAWVPDVGTAIALASEARAQADHAQATSGRDVVVAGSGNPLKELGAPPPPAAGAAGQCPQAPRPELPLVEPPAAAPGAAGVGAGGLAAGAVGVDRAACALGFATPAAEADMSALLAEIGALRLAVHKKRAESSSSSSQRRRKKDKKKKRERVQDKGKKKKKKGSSSSSSSSRSRSKSPLRWQEKGVNKPVSARKLHELETTKFKKRGDLLAYASLHPGALSAAFLAQVHLRCGLGQVRESKDLRSPSVRAWASKETGLTDVRDLREVGTLAAAIDHLNLGEAAQALDVLTQRVLAIQIAKQKGGSWERAERIEMIPPGSTLLAPSGVTQLAA